MFKKEGNYNIVVKRPNSHGDTSDLALILTLPSIIISFHLKLLLP